MRAANITAYTHGTYQEYISTYRSQNLTNLTSPKKNGRPNSHSYAEGANNNNGYSSVIVSFNIRRSNTSSSMFAAEIFAIKKATDHCLFHQKNSYLILSNSLLALKIITNEDNLKVLTSIITETLHRLHTSGKILLAWTLRTRRERRRQLAS